MCHTRGLANYLLYRLHPAICMALHSRKYSWANHSVDVAN